MFTFDFVVCFHCCERYCGAMTQWQNVGLSTARTGVRIHLLPFDA